MNPPGGLRNWTCPKCGRSFMIPDWAEGPKGCPRCANREILPDEPSVGQKLWNIATSLAAFVADGCRTVAASEYDARLQVCQACEERVETRCLKCGCHLPIKARARSMKCPLGKWPESIEVDEVN